MARAETTIYDATRIRFESREHGADGAGVPFGAVRIIAETSDGLVHDTLLMTPDGGSGIDLLRQLHADIGAMLERVDAEETTDAT